MKGFLIAAGIIFAPYLTDQQYAQGKYTSAVDTQGDSDAAFVWSLARTNFTCHVCGHRGADIRPRERRWGPGIN